MNQGGGDLCNVQYSEVQCACCVATHQHSTILQSPAPQPSQCPHLLSRFIYRKGALSSQKVHIGCGSHGERVFGLDEHGDINDDSVISVRFMLSRLRLALMKKTGEVEA